MSERHITINVLPQDAGAWLFIMVVLVMWAFVWGDAQTEKGKTERARIEAEARK